MPNKFAAADPCRVETQQKMAALFGPQYADMMVFDSIICNQDRHLGNFGYMVDNDTGEFLRPAPLFDHGVSLFQGAALYDLIHFEEYMEDAGGEGKYLRFDAVAELFLASRHLPLLQKLTSFRFTPHPRYNISPDVLRLIEKNVQARARRLLEIYRLTH